MSDQTTSEGIAGVGMFVETKFAQYSLSCWTVLFRERRRVIDINPDQIGVDQCQTECLVD